LVETACLYDVTQWWAVEFKIYVVKFIMLKTICDPFCLSKEFLK
jgi:hypothetical protein